MCGVSPDRNVCVCVYTHTHTSKCPERPAGVSRNTGPFAHTRIVGLCDVGEGRTSEREAIAE
jgi:hypothetical protein